MAMSRMDSVACSGVISDGAISRTGRPSASEERLGKPVQVNDVAVEVGRDYRLLDRVENLAMKCRGPV
jgi:hypothetical protein